MFGRLPNSELDDIAVAVVSRLVVTGGKHHRLHEELTVAGGYMKDNSFSRETRVTQVNAWLDKASFDRSERALVRRIEEALREKSGLHPANRGGALPRSTAEILKTRWRPENSKRSATSPPCWTSWSGPSQTELRKAGEPEQLALSSSTEDERTQVRRDTEALKLRLARIPEREGTGDRSDPPALRRLCRSGHSRWP